MIIGGLSGVINGLLGSGGGVIAVLGLERILKLPAKKAHGTAVAVMLPVTVVSFIVYLFRYDLELMTALWVTVGGCVGGIIGAKFLKKISAKWLHKIFGGLMIIAAVRMMF